jgi:hypothetical protein
MPRLELFAFRYRDPRTGNWIRARYVAERHEIAGFEIAVCARSGTWIRMRTLEGRS